MPKTCAQKKKRSHTTERHGALHRAAHGRAGAMCAPPPMRPPAATWRLSESGARGAQSESRMRRKSCEAVRCVVNGKRCRVLFKSAQCGACLQPGGEAAAAARRVCRSARRSADAHAASLTSAQQPWRLFRSTPPSSESQPRRPRTPAASAQPVPLSAQARATAARAAQCERGAETRLGVVASGLGRRPEAVRLPHDAACARGTHTRVREAQGEARKRRRDACAAPRCAALSRTGAVERLLHGRKQHVRGEHGRAARDAGRARVSAFRKRGAPASLKPRSGRCGPRSDAVVMLAAGVAPVVPPRAVACSRPRRAPPGVASLAAPRAAPRPRCSRSRVACSAGDGSRAPQRASAAAADTSAVAEPLFAADAPPVLFFVSVLSGPQSGAGLTARLRSAVGASAVRPAPWQQTVSV